MKEKKKKTMPNQVQKNGELSKRWKTEISECSYEDARFHGEITQGKIVHDVVRGFSACIFICEDQIHATLNANCILDEQFCDYSVIWHNRFQMAKLLLDPPFHQLLKCMYIPQNDLFLYILSFVDFNETLREALLDEIYGKFSFEREDMYED